MNIEHKNYPEEPTKNVCLQKNCAKLFLNDFNWLFEYYMIFLSMKNGLKKNLDFLYATA